MSEVNSSDLFEKCREGDISAVKRLLSTVSPRALNAVESNGSTCLHAACSSDHQEIVRLLLKNGASRTIKDANGKVAVELVQCQEVRKCFDRSEESTNEHFGVYKSTLTQWLLGQDYAESLARALQWRRIKNRGIEKTVKKILRSGILNNDESNGSKLTRYYLDEAVEKNDPVFLLKIYTIEGPFFSAFNQYMVTGGKGKIYKKLCHKWSGYYTGVLMNNPALQDFQFIGRTYRGMIISHIDLQQYKVGNALTNKAYQSTSKSKEVAFNFSHNREVEPHEVRVIVIYDFIDSKSALDIMKISEYPEEEEVLMLPGTCFKVCAVEQKNMEYEAYLRQLRISYR